MLQLIAEGFSNKEIGAALEITSKTAQNYRRSIMIKLGITSTVGLVHYAVQTRIVEMHPTKRVAA